MEKENKFFLLFFVFIISAFLVIEIQNNNTDIYKENDENEIHNQFLNVFSIQECVASIDLNNA